MWVEGESPVFRHRPCFPPSLSHPPPTTHRLTEWHGGDLPGSNVRQLVERHLRGRARVALAGDLHFYLRHSYARADPSDTTTPLLAPEHLIVNGLGGAFLHPTHTFAGAAFGVPGAGAAADARAGGAPAPPAPAPAPRGEYVCAAAYPPPATTLDLGRRNALNFRLLNTRFDVVGGALYFLVTVSTVPRCADVDALLDARGGAGAVAAAAARARWRRPRRRSLWSRPSPSPPSPPSSPCALRLPALAVWAS